MANLPTKFDRRVREVISYRAVWLPGAPVRLGDVMTLKKGLVSSVGSLAEFDVQFNSKKRQAARLALNASGVSETLIQAGVELPSVTGLDLTAKAELKVKFNRSDSYSLKTTELTGSDISNLLTVARRAAKADDWDFRDYYIAWRILEAREFSFLGSQEKGRELSFSGTGKALQKFLDTGVTAGISTSSKKTLAVELVGKGGPVAVGVTRVTRAGRPRDV